MLGEPSGLVVPTPGPRPSSGRVAPRTGLPLRATRGASPLLRRRSRRAQPTTAHGATVRPWPRPLALGTTVLAQVGRTHLEDGLRPALQPELLAALDPS